jgi:hypothetical protein
LREVLSDPEKAAAVGARGRLVAKERFDYRVIGRDLGETFRRLRAART